jgi:single-stranded DNA-binding protein
VVFGRTAEYAATLTKGAHLQIVGEIQTREYVAKDGAKKSVTEIRVQRINRLDRTSKSEEAAAYAAFSPLRRTNAQPQTVQQAAAQLISRWKPIALSSPGHIH